MLSEGAVPNQIQREEQGYNHYFGLKKKIGQRNERWGRSQADPALRNTDVGRYFFFPPTIVFFSSVAQKDPLSEKFSDTAYSYSRLSYCTSCIQGTVCSKIQMLQC